MKLSSPDISEPLWLQSFERLDALDPIPDNWRSTPVINSACEFADLMTLEVEMDFLVGKFPNFDEMISANVPTSIHHLYHLARWEAATGHRVSELGSVVEWGGGYGSMARLVKILNPDCSYQILDQEPMLRFARHFLDQCGIEGVSLRNAYGSDLVEESINPDLFISTWALSESGAKAQDWVFANRLFDAHGLLLAFNPVGDFVDASTFMDHVNKVSGLREMAADGQSEYLFRGLA